MGGEKKGKLTNVDSYSGQCLTSLDINHRFIGKWSEGLEVCADDIFDLSLR